MTTILLADDHSILRQGLRLLLETEPGLKLVGEAADGQATLRLMEQKKPDILIVDLNMPELSGLEVTRQVKHRFPQTKVIILSMYTEEYYVIEALQNGASAYVLKQSNQSNLLQAIREVIAGRRYLSPPLSEHELEIYKKCKEKSQSDSYNTLSDREREILFLIAEGHTAPEIAEKLFISPRTIEHHQEHLLQKLHLHHRSDLIRYAVERGILLRPLEPLNKKKAKKKK